MNRERLKTLRDHLAGLPDERVDMSTFKKDEECGTVACIAGWATVIFPPMTAMTVGDGLGLSFDQQEALFTPADYHLELYTRTDAIAAIDSMLANPDDLALPVWPEKVEVSA